MSATTSDVGRMLIRIEATTAALRGQLADAEGRIGQFTRSTEQKLGGFERMFQAVGQNALRSIAGIAAGILAVNSVSQALGNMVRVADQAAQSATRIGSALGNMQGGRQVFDQISASAQRTGTSAADAVDSFLRFSIATRQIGGTNQQALQLVDMLQKMAVVSGTVGQAGGAAMTQLGQALASGRLQGDELRSILENMPTLAEGLANQLGVSVGMLRQMGTEGKLTSETVFAALLRMAPEINRQFEQMPNSVERATNSLSQAWSNLTMQLDRASGMTDRIAAATQGAADRVQRLAASFVPKTAADELREVNEQIERLVRLQREAGEAGLRSQGHRGAIGTGAANAAAALYGTEGMREQLRLLREQAEELRKRADAEKAAADAAAAAEAAQAALRAEENARQQVLERLKAAQEALGGTNDKTREQVDALRTIVAAGDEAMRRYGVSAQMAAGMLSQLEASADKVSSTIAGLNAQTRETLAGGVAGRILAQQRAAGLLDSGGNLIAGREADADRVAEAERRRSEALAAVRIQQAEAEAALARARRNGQEAGERLAQVEQQVAEAARDGATDAQQAALRTALLTAAQDRNTASAQGNLQSIAKVRQELTLVATAAERAADAATQGAAAERRAEQASKARTQALKVARDGTAAYTAAYREFLALIEREGRGQARQEITRRGDALRDEIALIQRETELVGALPGHREAEIAALRIRQELLASGKQFTEDEIRAVEDLARRRARATQAQQQAEQQLQQVRQVSNEIARDVSTALFDQMMDRDKASSILDWFKALFRRIAIAAIQAQIVLPITQQIVGAAPGLFGATGQAGGGMSLGGLFGGGAGTPITDASGSITGYIGQAGNMSSGQTILGGLRGMNPGNYISGATPINTGWGWADSALNTPIFGNSGASAGMAGGDAVGSYIGGNGLTYGGAALGAAGIAGGIYSAYSGIQRGGIGGYTSAAGGAATAGLSAAAMAGLSVPIYGWIAAAVLSIVGALLPGRKASGRGQETRVDLQNGAERFNGRGGDRFSAANRDQSQGAAQQVANLAKQVSASLGGIPLAGEAAVGVTSSRGSGEGIIYLEVNGRRAQFENSEAGAEEMAKRAGEFIINDLISRASGPAWGILNASAGNMEKLQQDIAWYEEVYKSFGRTTQAASAFQQALDQLNGAYQQHIDRAASLSLAIGDVVAARDKEVASLIARRDLDVRAYELGLDLRLGRATQGDTLDFQLAAFDMQAEQARDQARTQLEAWGLEASRVSQLLAKQEQVFGAERLRVQQEYNGASIEQQRQAAEQSAAEQAQALQQAAGSALGVVTSMRDYVRGLSTSEASAGTVLDRYAAASQDFNAIYGAARAGDANSIAGLQNAAEAYRGLAREIYGGGQGYADAIRLIGDRLDGVVGMGAEALTQSFQRAETDRMVDAIGTVTTAIDDLRAENAQLRRDINMLMMRPAA